MESKKRFKGVLVFSLFLMACIAFAVIYNEESHKIGQLSFYVHPYNK